MRLGQRLLLILLALLTFTVASHQAMASTVLAEPCRQEAHIAADATHATIKMDHCVTCCQTNQALPSATGALDFDTATLQVTGRTARYASIELALHGKLLRPPRLV